MSLDKQIDLINILQCMGDAFVSLDKDWRYQFANDKALRLMGKTYDELIGRILWEAFPDIVGTIFDLEYRKVMEERQQSSFETYYPSYDMWLEVRAYPHDNGISVFYTDITEKKKKQAEIHELLQRLQLFGKHNPAGIFHVDGNGKCISVNDRWLEITGYAREKILGKKWLEALDAVDKPAWQHSLNDGDMLSDSFTHQNNVTGQIRQVSIKVTPVYLDNKELKGYVGFIEDITELIKANEIITESEKWFRNVVENAPVMIWQAGPGKTLDYVNKTWLEFTGNSLEQEVSDVWISNIFSEDRERVLKNYDRAFDKRQTFRTEYRLKDKNNIYRWVSVTGKPLYTPNNTFLGYVGCCADIDEQVMIYKELEKKVTERTLDLSAALEREVELSNIKSRFVAIASHEFRTPLSAILSSAELIEQYIALNEPEKLKKHINRVKTTVTHLTDILDDFLSLEKLEQGKVETGKDNFDLRQFVTEIVENLENSFKPGQKINYYYAGDDMVVSDKKIIYNVLLNLLSNGIKYSDDDVRLDVVVDDTQVSITVTDKGIGIPEEDQKNLFSKYFRATNVGSIKGTGLGLNIIQRYVELLNGTISFTSTRNVGTKFIVQLPRDNSGSSANAYSP